MAGTVLDDLADLEATMSAFQRAIKPVCDGLEATMSETQRVAVRGEQMLLDCIYDMDREREERQQLYRRWMLARKSVHQHQLQPPRRPNHKNLWSVIEEHLSRTKQTGEAFADAAGISGKTLYNIRRGCRVSDGTIRGVAQAIGVTPEDLRKRS
jgi:hypothetical protein